MKLTTSASRHDLVYQEIRTNHENAKSSAEALISAASDKGIAVVQNGALQLVAEPNDTNCEKLIAKNGYFDSPATKDQLQHFFNTLQAITTGLLPSEKRCITDIQTAADTCVSMLKNAKAENPEALATHVFNVMAHITMATPEDKRLPTNQHRNRA